MEAKSPYCRITPKSPFHGERSRPQHLTRRDVTALNYPSRWGGQGHATANYSNYQGLITVKWHCYTWICMRCHFCWPWGKHPHRNAKMETLNGDEAKRLDFKMAFRVFYSQQDSAIRGRQLQESINSNHFHPDSQLSRWDFWLLIKYSSLALMRPQIHFIIFLGLIKSELYSWK